ncbi:MAG: OprO/OprP family phosphate-selective porin [Pseudomonadales bacterium]|nr:OprO/OprP family phosphate-selective porin [Pseudomonadales bacterium]
MKQMLLGALALSVVAANAGAASEDVNTLKIKQLKDQLEAQQEQIDALADALENKSGSTGAEWFNKTTIGGYGEHHFNHKKGGSGDKADDQVDAHRFVLFIGHEFTDTVLFFSEVELEHSLAGDGKPGEVELEQAYIEWDYASAHSLIMGQFLLPVGIINETHEPDTFYGVERNLVESRIIPATWWETGVMSQGEIAQGLSYNIAVHSGLYTEPTSDGIEAIRSGRQKSAEANAEDLAYTTRIKYTGVKGLEAAITYQHQQDLTQSDENSAETNSADLIVAHVIYNVGDFGVRALWAEWDIDGDVPEASGQDQQEGYYIEGSYKLRSDLGVFARFEEYDEKAGSDADTEKEASVVGVNYWLADTVVIKADYTDIDAEGVDDVDSINLGIGWSY